MRHKRACTITETVLKLEILDLSRGEIVLFVTSEKKGADQLCSNCTADLCPCFCIGKLWFSYDAVYKAFQTLGIYFLSLYTVIRLHRHSRQVCAVSAEIKDE